MLTALLFAAGLVGSPMAASGQVAVIARTPAPTAPAAATDPAAETVRVCRWETVTGSNRRNRVCRDVPRRGVQDQQTREFMRDNQRWTPPPSG